MTQSLIEAIHAAPLKLSMCVCGAGVSAVSMLTGVAGCSRTLVMAEMPYAPHATAHVLNYQPRQVVSAVVAQQLAQHAYHNCVTHHIPVPAAPRPAAGDGATVLVGVGATSAIRTDRVRHGKDQAFVCVWGDGTTHGVTHYHLELTPHTTREEQERAVAQLILHAIAQAAGAQGADSHEQKITQGSSVLSGTLTCTTSSLPPAEQAVSQLIDRVLDATVPAVVWNAHGEVRAALTPYGTEEGDGVARLLYPGSYRPLHWGHTELARAAAKAVGRRMGCAEVCVTYEIAARIADKGTLSSDDLAARVRQFLARRERVAVTRATLFVEKAALFPGHGFVIGVDTARRVLDPVYYAGGTTANMVRALLHDIADRGCYFVVGGRQRSDASGDGAPSTWDDPCAMAIPDELRRLFVPLSEHEFRVDVSSTELRARQARLTPSV